MWTSPKCGALHSSKAVKLALKQEAELEAVKPKKEGRHDGIADHLYLFMSAPLSSLREYGRQSISDSSKLGVV